METEYFLFMTQPQVNLTYITILIYVSERERFPNYSFILNLCCSLLPIYFQSVIGISLFLSVIDTIQQSPMYNTVGAA